MPVKVEQHEPMIYRSQWQNPLTLADIEAGWQQQTQMAIKAEDRAYVAIIDVHDTDEIPADVRALSKILTSDSRCIHICFIGVEPAMRLFFNTLAKASHKANEYEIIERLTDALHKAHLTLRERGYFPNDDETGEFTIY